VSHRLSIENKELIKAWGLAFCGCPDTACSAGLSQAPAKGLKTGQFKPPHLACGFCRDERLDWLE